MKNVLIYLGVLILATTIAMAAQVTLDPIEMYETSEADFNIEVNNFQGTDVINQLVLTMQNFQATDVLDFIGWTTSFSSSQITWSDGTIETNVQSALFIFSSQAPLVTQDETHQLTGTLYYDDTTTQVFTANITIRNDDTPPVLNEIFPADNGYARAYNANQEIRINASDSETGIKSVAYEYSDCSTGSTNVQLGCNKGYCTGTADFTNYGEADTACFTATITNNANEVTIITGSFGFDETPPTVTLLSPINNDYAGNSFSFNVQDNKAVDFDCEIEIDNNNVQSLYAYEGNNVFTLTANINEGAHDWKVICQDVVGLQGEDEDSFIYDITLPTILLNNPANGSGIKDQTIDITVSDNYEVSSVDYSTDLDSINWNIGWNTLTVTAEDAAGNQAIKDFNFYVDKTPPTIDITSPLNDETLDYHGNFVLTVTDDFDNEIECALSTSVTNPVSQGLISGVESTITVLLPLGGLTWSVLCVDDLGNSIQSSTLNAVSEDLTGPDIAIQDITYIARGSNIDVTATITDISGVKEARAYFETQEITLTANTDIYTGTFSTGSNMNTGEYTINVLATDDKDMQNTEDEDLTIVEAYTIDFNLPSTAEPNQEITITGSITKDDSTLVQGTVKIEYPGGIEEITLDTNAEFSYSFFAPAADNTYEVRVSHETNVLIYSKTESFSVVSPPGSSSHGWGDQSGNYNPPSSSGFEITSSDIDSVAEPQEASASELVEEIEEEEPRVPAITGATTGVFSKNSIWWIAALVGLILAAITVHGFYSLRKKNKPKIDWGERFR